MHDIALVLALLAVVAALVSLANRLSLPYPILLVIGGLCLGFIPNQVLPDVVLEPDCTIYVPEGWRGRPGAGGALVLTR